MQTLRPLGEGQYEGTRLLPVSVYLELHRSIVHTLYHPFSAYINIVFSDKILNRASHISFARLYYDKDCIRALGNRPFIKCWNRY